MSTWACINQSALASRELLLNSRSRIEKGRADEQIILRILADRINRADEMATTCQKSPGGRAGRGAALLEERVEVRLVGAAPLLDETAGANGGRVEENVAAWIRWTCL
jgi:hypothetical protein